MTEETDCGVVGSGRLEIQRKAGTDGFGDGEQSCFDGWKVVGCANEWERVSISVTSDCARMSGVGGIAYALDWFAYSL